MIQLEKLWDHPRPHTLRTRVEAGDIDGLNHTNNAVYVKWCEQVAWSHSVALGLDLETYRTLEIVRPGQEEVLWNTGGQLDVSMRVEPRLQIGHRVSLYLNDQAVEVRPGSLQAQLTEVPRGVHVLRAEVRDRTGTGHDTLHDRGPINQIK